MGYLSIRCRRRAFSNSGSEVEPIQHKTVSQATRIEPCDFQEQLILANSVATEVIIPISDLHHNGHSATKKDQHSNRGSNLALYFQELSKIQLLTRRQEIELAQQMVWWNTMISQTLALFPSATDLVLARLEEAKRAGRRPTDLVTGILDRKAVGLVDYLTFNARSANFLTRKADTRVGWMSGSEIRHFS